MIFSYSFVCRLVGMTSPGSRNPEPIESDTGFPFLNDNSLKFLDRLSVPVPHTRRRTKTINFIMGNYNVFMISIPLPCKSRQLILSFFFLPILRANV